MQKKLAKIKIDFFDLFGVGGAGWRCRSFLLKKNIAIGFFFFYIFYSVKFGTFFFDDLAKSTLLAGGNSKSYGNFEF